MTNTDKERADFEEWCEGYGLDTRRNDDGRYFYPMTETAWLAWQSRALASFVAGLEAGRAEASRCEHCTSAGYPSDDPHRFAVVSANFVRPFLLGAYGTMGAAQKAQCGSPDKWLIYERAVPYAERAEAVTDAERRRELLAAEDDRQEKLHELLEIIREQIRVGVAPEHRPKSLMKNIQDAVYTMRGRTPLLADAAIAPARPEPSPDVEAHKFRLGDRVRKSKGSSWQGLGSGLTNQSQKITVAAMQMAEKKV